MLIDKLNDVHCDIHSSYAIFYNRFYELMNDINIDRKSGVSESSIFRIKSGPRIGETDTLSDLSEPRIDRGSLIECSHIQ